MRHVVYDVTAGLMIACWTVVALVWAAGGVRGVAGEQAVGDREGRDGASRIAAAVAILIVLAPASLWRPLVVASPAVRIAGCTLLVLGTGLTVWSRLALGGMWASGALVRSGHVLRTGGPYRFTRHPIYTCVLGMVAATALAQGVGRWLPLLLVVAAALVFKAMTEEKLLLREFPEEYARYCRRVPRLLPFPRPRHADPA